LFTRVTPKQQLSELINGPKISTWGVSWLYLQNNRQIKPFLIQTNSKWKTNCWRLPYWSSY